MIVKVALMDRQMDAVAWRTSNGRSAELNLSEFNNTAGCLRSDLNTTLMEYW
ncbi:MAG: hypothetical protein V3V31_08940 [Methylococcales bacterium]